MYGPGKLHDGLRTVALFDWEWIMVAMYRRVKQGLLLQIRRIDQILAYLLTPKRNV